MATATKPIPEGYHSATPYLIVKGAAEAIDFYKRAFCATESFRMADPKGGIAHAEIKIGDSVIMLAAERPNMGYRGPRSLGGSAVSMMLYVTDADSTLDGRVKGGAKTEGPGGGQVYGCPA